MRNLAWVLTKEKVSFRSWNGQLRQPVLLAAPRSMVSVSPQEGYIHPVSELDTLGKDQNLLVNFKNFNTLFK